MASKVTTTGAPRHGGGEPIATADELSPPVPTTSSGQMTHADELMPELKAMLNEGIGVLLKEVTARGILDPPYGHSPLPDPEKILQSTGIGDDDAAEEGDGDDDDDDDAGDGGEGVAGAGAAEGEDFAPPYKYEYGFNPLVFLGTWLKMHNPRFIAAREADRAKAVEALARQGRHAKHRDLTCSQLQLRIPHRRSGIVYAPVVGCISQNSCVLWAKALKPGTLVMEMGLSDNFSTPPLRVISLPVDDVTENTAVALLNDLRGGTIYHYRVYLRTTVSQQQQHQLLDNDDDNDDNPDAKTYARIGKFTTLSEDGAVSIGIFATCKSPLPTTRTTSSQGAVESGNDDGDGHATSGGDISGGGGSHGSWLDVTEQVAGSLNAASPSICVVVGDPSFPLAYAAPCTTTATAAAAGGAAIRCRGGDVSLASRTARVARYNTSHRVVEGSAALSKLLSTTACVTAWRDHKDEALSRIRAEQMALTGAHRASSTNTSATIAGDETGECINDVIITEISKSREGVDVAQLYWPLLHFHLNPENSIKNSNLLLLPYGGGGGGAGAGIIGSSVKSLHRCIRLNSHADLFVLDTRDGMVGKEQADWLKHCLVSQLRPSAASLSAMTSSSSISLSSTTSPPSSSSSSSSSHAAVWRLIAVAAAIPSSSPSYTDSSNVTADVSDHRKEAATTATTTTTTSPPLIQEGGYSGRVGVEGGALQMKRAEGRVSYDDGGILGDNADDQGEGEAQFESIDTLQEWIYANGCANVVFFTTRTTTIADTSRFPPMDGKGDGGGDINAEAPTPYVVRYYERNKEQSKYPVHEFTCGALLVPTTAKNIPPAAGGMGLPTEEEGGQDLSGKPGNALNTSSNSSYMVGGVCHEGDAESHHHRNLKASKVLMSFVPTCLAVSTMVNISEKGALTFLVRAAEQKELTATTPGEDEVGGVSGGDTGEQLLRSSNIGGSGGGGGGGDGGGGGGGIAAGQLHSLRLKPYALS